MTRRRPRKRTSPSRILRESAAHGHLGSGGHFNSIHNFLADPATTAVPASLVAIADELVRYWESEESGHATSICTYQEAVDKCKNMT